MSELKDAAYRWWKQARQNNYDAWAHVRNLVRALQAGEDCAKEVKEYEFLFDLQKDRLDEAIAEAEKLAEALETWWGGKCPEAWSGQMHRDRPYVNTQGSNERGLVDALAAYRNRPQVSQDVDTSIKAHPIRDTKTGADLCQTLIEFIETDHDYGCECSACRAIAEHRKVASDATITQEDT